MRLQRVGHDLVTKQQQQQQQQNELDFTPTDLLNIKEVSKVKTLQRKSKGL